MRVTPVLLSDPDRLILYFFLLSFQRSKELIHLSISSCRSKPAPVLALSLSLPIPIYRSLFRKEGMNMKLVLIRHEQSEWNLKNLFTGWTDVE